MPREFGPLRFATRQTCQRLAEAQVAYAEGTECSERGGQPRRIGKVRKQVSGSRLQKIRDIPAIYPNFQHVGVKAEAGANRTRHVDVGEELHIDGHCAEPFARRTPPTVLVEAENGRAEAARLGEVCGSEHVAHDIPNAKVGSAVGTDRPWRQGGVDPHNFAEVVAAHWLAQERLAV